MVGSSILLGTEKKGRKITYLYRRVVMDLVIKVLGSWATYLPFP